MTHPYITAYNELESYSAVARLFDTNDKAVRKIVHPEKHAMLNDQRKVREGEVRRLKRNNKRYLEYFGRFVT